MLKIVSANLNGVRSAARKGFFEWMDQEAPHFVCVQELKAQAPDMTTDFIAPNGYRGHFHFAQKKGYSGVGIYAKQEPDAVTVGFGIEEFDNEGRYIQCDFGKLSVVSVYCPSGSSGEERQQAKFRFMEVFLPHLQKLRECGQEVVLCGDWNIAHQQIDLKNWKGNQKNSGFLPEERAWMSRLFNEVGWVDVYRRLHPETTEEAYTWWSNRGQAWAKNVGWRLDYQIATRDMAERARHAAIYKQQRFSDHAPLSIHYTL